MSLIQCQGLSKLYGSKKALNDVNFSLEAGAPIALVGPNGAGKTTLFSLLCGYMSPSAGTITLLGEAPNSPKLLGKIAALPQDAVLDPNLTIVSQLSFFARLQGMGVEQARQEAIRVLTLVDLADVAEQKPPSLSHGMSKRVSIAQALIGSPELVLLDEPTAGLDPANAKKVRELVKALSPTTTFMISSHNLDELEKLCDQVLYLDKGQLSQAVSMHASTDSDYLTLTMQTCDSEVLQAEVAKLAGVVNVSSKQSKVFIIQLATDAEKAQNSDIEMRLFTLFNQHQWQYKMLLKGRTLEETLFS
ncbi:MAG: ABC transporter ATP-binding protein [Gammaproteobacteria bacterium]|uniref:ABC transporter ATP-binding protein n=1 Tax=Shewanella septentrionalis TaxID=2952223 RepID=A0A9X2WVX8_9GAMM|nr:ABC transporter ATP-binding protein [Shewanella septentrionalis]EGT3625706.1 ABC transporter ATP-binding protein [Morganella morganii]MBU1390937.1 ABC transporter ATP-binding protein [Gammaproteobacteria bacterium]QYX66458.1 ABC transporter ATP-binding protein [Shewanella putrefaciens]MBU1476160.1 ABC transporter ATP-binding protein [Gammaproteobacteria bacterium]MBU2001751.1 ABC transporter ATP-binding protein [Gammaproteobacteria bacterium]